MRNDESCDTDFDSNSDIEFVEKDSDSGGGTSSCDHHVAVTNICADNQGSFNEDTCTMVTFLFLHASTGGSVFEQMFFISFFL